MDGDRYIPTFRGHLTVPHLPESTGRADVLGTSPICVGGAMSLQNHYRSRSPPHAGMHASIGHPLYRRSRSPSPSITDNVEIVDDELRNFARQPSADAASQRSTDQSPTNRSGNNNQSDTVYGSCSCGSTFTPHMEDMFRRQLRFFFMNPCEKWRAKRRFPYKLIIQVFKIIIVTSQLIGFGNERSGHVDFLSKNNLAFRHLFLNHWDATYETLPYPPAAGIYAAYEIDAVLDNIDYALRRYNETKQIAIGSYDFTNASGSIPPILMCINKFEEGNIWPHNESFIFNSDIVNECFNITAVDVMNSTTHKMEKKFDIRVFLRENDKEISFDSLNILRLKFALKTVHLRTADFRLAQADCFQFDIAIKFDNAQHNGQVPIILESEAFQLPCYGKIVHRASVVISIARRALDFLVIAIGCLSFVLCVRTLYRSQKLKRKTTQFFKVRYNKKMSFYEQSAFLNLWDVLIVINDILTVTGTAMKILIEEKHSENYELCGMMLGTGNLLVWLGVLRYLSFFEHYNILILTMKQAIPDIVRFLVCASVFYMGFAFCGWIVLGPYHIKFRTLSESSECLFALVNGDEIFVTYADTDATNTYIYIFSRVYLYLFISLFMYVVYSLFTSIIITTYETIKFYYREGFPKSELQKFMDEHEEDASSPLFRSDRYSGHRGGCICCMMPCFKCCCKEDHHEYPDEHTAIVN